MKSDLLCTKPCTEKKFFGWLVCSWSFGRPLKHWQTGVIIYVWLHTKENRKEYIDYHGVACLGPPGKVCAEWIKRRYRELFELKLEDTQCYCRLGRWTTDQIFTPQKISRNLRSMTLSTSTKHTTQLLKKKLCGLLQENGVYDSRLLAVTPLCSCPDVCNRIHGVKSEPFPVGVGYRQGCVLSPFLFAVYTISRRQSQLA